ncbi:MAG: sulfatase-like hydrolase/transferase, partial [gamma proteobacterium symbiont of Bathyaustriella thionipta]|nr:sulfatase-like hydrolase/transferase [gamma proteobacterium symbiont of Bathyaustriella thionipta]
LFVVLADHCAGSAGKENLPINKYHIPLWIYSPAHIKPQIITTRSSQIDVAPTLLGLLNMDYNSWFFGQDILKPSEKKMALMGNYQYLGLYQNTTLSILKPKKQTEQYTGQMDIRTKQLKQNRNKTDTALLDKTISYYQTAAYILKNRLNAWSLWMALNEKKNLQKKGVSMR